MKEEHPFLSVCMIVKDEEENLALALSSVVDLADEIIVVDTGSSDGSVPLADYFGATVYSYPWEGDFSLARNQGLDKAKGEWVLVLDADEVLEEGDQLLRLLRQTSEQVVAYFLTIENCYDQSGFIESSFDTVLRVFRNRKEFRFSGKIHEQIAPAIIEYSPKEIISLMEGPQLKHSGYLKSQVEKKDKLGRNLGMLREALKENPSDRLIRYHYGVELYRNQKFKEALEIFKEVGEGLDTKVIYGPKLMRYIVMSLYSLNNKSEALKYCNMGLGYYPDYPDLYYLKGLIAYQDRDIVEALKSFEAAMRIKEFPPYYACQAGANSYRSIFYRGLIYRELKLYDEALEDFLKVLKINPRFLIALEEIVRILNPEKHWEYTLECLNKVFDFSEPSAHGILGEILFKEGLYEKALIFLKRAPRSSYYKLLIGEAHIHLGEFLPAIKELKSIPSVSIYYLQALQNLFISHWLQGHNQKTKKLLLEMEQNELNEDVLRFYEFLQHILTRQTELSFQDTDAIRPMLVKAYELASKYGIPILEEPLGETMLIIKNGVYHRAMLKKKTGQLDLAERELVSALLNEKNERQIYLEGLYRVYKEQKKWLAAEKTIRQLIAIKPKDLALTVELAEVFYEQGLESLLELKSVLPETTWVTQGIDQIDEILTRLRGD